PTDITFRDYLQKAGKAQDLAMTDARVCAVMSAGEVICWGHSPWFSDEPSREYGVDQVEGITAGATGHFCVRKEGGHVQCWGDGKTGARGKGPYGRNEMPGLFQDVQAGFDFACAVSTDLSCWGTNDAGQLAMDFQDAVVRPTLLDDDDGMKAIAAGDG